MATFHLQHNEQRRVFLDTELRKNSVSIRTIEAENWVAARAEILDYEFPYMQGYGYVYHD